MRADLSLAAVDFSLIGDLAGLTAAQLAAISSGTGNLTGVDAMLEPLADNGGPTPTHALKPDSPARNAGDPDTAAGAGGVPLHDQRGLVYSRVSGGRLDIGAFEEQPHPAFADFDGDRDVDGNDFLIWQRGLTTTPAERADGDADHNEAVDGADLAVWQSQFGLALPPIPFDLAGAAGVARTTASDEAATLIELSASLIDAALAVAIQSETELDQLYVSHARGFHKKARSACFVAAATSLSSYGSANCNRSFDGSR